MEVAHWAAFMPAVLLLALPGPHGRALWLIAAGFAVSFVGDLIALSLDGPNTWLATHIYLPVQMALFLAAVAPTRQAFVRGAVVLVLAVAVNVQQLAAVGPAPEVLVTALGSLLVVWHALGRDAPLRSSLVVYCGFGSVLYLAMVGNLSDRPSFLAWWFAYQSARFVSFSMFAVGVLAVREQRGAWR